MPLGWAIVSTGRHPDIKMAPAINAASDSRIAAVVSRDSGRAQAFAEKHGAAATYDSLMDMLSDSAIDVVYIASPNALHAEQTIAAAKAGKHVLVEKPMALSVEDCQRMIDACESAGVQLGVGFHLRSHPGHQRLRDLVQDGSLGRISLTESNWGRGTRGQDSPPARTGLQAWWDDPALIGAGAFMATGVHCVDTMRFVTGREVTEVSAITDAAPGHPLEELAVLSFRFDDGSLGRLMTGRRTPDFEHNDLAVYGTLGRGDLQGSIGMELGGTLSVRTDAITQDQRYEPDPTSLYTWQVDAFNRAVQDESRPLATGQDGLRVTEVTLAMLQSARTGRRVSIG